LRERVDDIPGLVDFFVKKYTSKYTKNCNRVSTAAIAKLKRHKWQGNVRELQHAVEKAVILCESNTLDIDDFFFHSIKNSPDEYPDDLSIVANEKLLIKKAMELCQGNITKTCNALGITRKTLYNKIKKYDL
jgi:DNA-binding NtrC family response regulator